MEDLNKAIEKSIPGIHDRPATRAERRDAAWGL